MLQCQKYNKFNHCLNNKISKISISTPNLKYLSGGQVPKCKAYAAIKRMSNADRNIGTTLYNLNYRTAVNLQNFTYRFGIIFVPIY